MGLPDGTGSLAHVLFGIEDAAAEWHDLFRPGLLPGLLPAGIYRFANSPHDLRLATLAFALGHYKFARYRKNESSGAQLVPPGDIDMREIERMAGRSDFGRAISSTRPPMIGAGRIGNGWRRHSRTSSARIFLHRWRRPTRAEFPLIHAVGRASTRAPRLIDFKWGNASHPKVTLVGKGVCFDTGGLDLKPSSGMLIMKKDIGWRGQCVGAGVHDYGRKTEVNLRVLIPAVENSVAGNAFRPLDIFPSRKG